jgi:phosphotransferase system HPr (HPr) family protein
MVRKKQSPKFKSEKGPVSPQDIAMDGFSRTLEVLNGQGIHFRPADLLKKIGDKYDFDVWLTKDDQTISARDGFQMIPLEMSQGTRFTISASGYRNPEEAREYLDRVERLVNNRFYEDDDANPTVPDAVKLL